MSDNKIISVNNLFSVYNENEDNQYVALSNINFDFKQNKIYFIIGNSGSGKSTLVAHFNGLINTKYGNIDIYPDLNKVKKTIINLVDAKLGKQLTNQILDSNKFSDIIVLNTKSLSKTQIKSLIEVSTRQKIKKLQINKSLNKLINNICSTDELELLDENLKSHIKSVNNKHKTSLLENKMFVNVLWENNDQIEIKNIRTIHSFKELDIDNQIDKVSKQTKLHIKQNQVIPLGFNWNIHNTLIGLLVNEEKKHFTKNNGSEIVFFNNRKISTKIAKLLIEGYYKVRVSKIKKINDIQLLINKVKNKSAFEITLAAEPCVNILDRLTLLEVNNCNQTTNILKPNSIQKSKLKKIKNFKQLRREIGMVFQFPEYQLFKDTIEKDIMFGPIALGIKKEEAKKRAKFYLNKLDMGDEYLPRNPFGLSGGQKRRVAIAGILAIETDVLIFDEPTAGLDPVGEHETMKMIKEIQETGKSVFVITHTMDHALEVADEIVVLNDGEIIKHGDPYSIFLDDEIIQRTSIDTPKVIKTIKLLIEKDPRFEKLIDYKPKTTQELNNAIIDLVHKLKKRGESHVSTAN